MRMLNSIVIEGIVGNVSDEARSFTIECYMNDVTYEFSVSCEGDTLSVRDGAHVRIVGFLTRLGGEVFVRAEHIEMAGGN